MQPPLCCVSSIHPPRRAAPPSRMPGSIGVNALEIGISPATNPFPPAALARSLLILMEFPLLEILKSIAGARLQNTRYVTSEHVEAVDRSPRVSSYGRRGSRTERNATSEQSVLVRL